MADLVEITARDGSVVQYVVDGEPKSGSIKNVYFSKDRSYVVAFFKKEIDEQSERRLEKLVGNYRTSIFNGVGGDYWRKVFCWPTKIVEGEVGGKKRIGFVMPAYDSDFYFQTGNLKGKEKEGKWWAAAKNYNCFVPASERGSLTGFLHACLELCRAVRRLHAAGLAHSDLSYKNCLIDPVKGRACLIDVDGLVVPELFPPAVLGTRHFMAPEIIVTSKLPKNDPNFVSPSRLTDLHSLAVFIYLCLLHRHPLQGKKYREMEDPEKHDFMQLGKDPVFIESPSDVSNRFTMERGDEKGLPWVDPQRVPYTVCGPYLKNLFDKAFIDGLLTPMRRPTANDWEDALIKTLDLVLPCANPKCMKHEFVYAADSPRQSCPYCGMPYKDSVPVFDFYFSRNGIDYKPDGRMLVGYVGKELFLWNVERNVEFNEKLAPEQLLRVAFLSKEGDDWFLNNERIRNLYDLTNQKPVPCGTAVKLTENLRLSLSEQKNSYVAQIRLVNQRKALGSDAALALFLEIADSSISKEATRVDALLQRVLKWGLTAGRVGVPYQCALNFKDLAASGRNVSVSIAKTQGFEDFGLVCSVENDALIISGVPERSYNGRIEVYFAGRYRTYHLFQTSKIPGEFSFSGVHVSKTWEVKEVLDVESGSAEHAVSSGDVLDAPNDSSASDAAQDPAPAKK